MEKIREEPSYSALVSVYVPVPVLEYCRKNRVQRSKIMRDALIDYVNQLQNQGTKFDLRAEK